MTIMNKYICIKAMEALYYSLSVAYAVVGLRESLYEANFAKQPRQMTCLFIVFYSSHTALHIRM